ncbi:hypothetical protein PIB30_062869, partial [Stylosanthes scabra]|nr:hypothetical protein [Stylosanthes scabra]
WLGYGVKYGNDLSCRSLRATDARNRVNFDAVNATPLPAVWGPLMRQTSFGAKCTTGEFFLVTRDLLEFC